MFVRSSRTNLKYWKISPIIFFRKIDRNPGLSSLVVAWRATWCAGWLRGPQIRWDGMGLLACCWPEGTNTIDLSSPFSRWPVGPAGTGGIWRCGGRGPTVQWLLLSAADVSIDQSSTRYLVYIYYYYLKKERSNLVLLWYLVLLSIVIGAFWYINPKKHVEWVQIDLACDPFFHFYI